ncbi:MAG: DNA cytosine methyltransferase, partial [Thaumarchaeota archaeon]|nr:DNA cytosine methyltransferase [Nitrososphaerota archaeon]
TLLREEDEQVAHRFTEVYQRRFNLLLNARVDRAYREGTETVLDVTVDGRTQQVRSDALLMATGRVPNTDLLEVANTGVEVDQQGFIKVDEYLETNVPGIWAMQRGKVVETLLSGFKSLGYHNADAWLLNAADYGVPQLRKRAFLIGSKSRIPIEKPKKTHGTDIEVKKNPRLLPHITLIEAIGDLPRIPCGKAQTNTDEYTRHPENDYQEEMRKRSDKVTNHVVTINSPQVIKRIKTVPPGGNWENIPVRLMKVNGKYSKIEMVHSMIYKRLLKNEPSITITNFRKGMIIHPTQDRLLSVREAARVQSFHDDFLFEGGLSKQQQQVSDAVPTKLANKVGDSILLHLHQIIKLTPVKV